MSEIIGKRFRRNKYGLSLWEDKIREVVYHLELITPFPKVEKVNGIMRPVNYIKAKQAAAVNGFRVVPKVLGYNTLTSYEFDEIVVYLK